MNRTFGFLVGGTFAIWLLYAAVVKNVEMLRVDNWPGSFGDSFGALNTLFTGLAFAGLIASIALQRTELAMQREELTLQREVLKSQSDELAAQVEALKRSAEAQERTAVAQERVAKAQARSALIVAKAEKLRATEAALNAMGGYGDNQWVARRANLRETRERLIADISAMAEQSE